MLEGIGPLHLLIVLVVALIVIGPGKLPEVGSALGKGIREFRSAVSDRPDPAVMTTPASPATPATGGTPSSPEQPET